MNQAITSGNTMRLGDVGSMYGAPIGRRGVHAARDAQLRFVVHTCPLDVQGYDEGGAYWGGRSAGHSLWRAVSENGEAEFFFDAGDRETAIAHVRAMYPQSEIVETPLERLAEEFILGYIDAALFVSDDMREGHETTDLRAYPVSEQTGALMRAECLGFIEGNRKPLELAYAHPGYRASDAGADLWYTRNGHGVGFWEKSLRPDDTFDALTRAANSTGERSLFVGDDGLVYQA